ncbi:MAG TPA: NADP-dependent phosphogluconate dehydrogenase [Nevskiaceae bacterium]|nr:NADP-dependent phosphogluconate dehydrogenase [Nevskiaceae bacterium]
MATRQRSSGADLAIVGLGRMGGNLARQALARGLRVAGYTQGGKTDLRHRRFTLAAQLEQLPPLLKRPRKIFLYVPAGAAVDQLAAQLAPLLQPGDILLDGGNSYWGDSLRRAQRLQASGIHWLDLGTSGGVDGARHGACFMIGGPRAAVAQVAPLLRRLAVPGGYVHAGGSGAGHFTKLVHNGIEFGMLQAIGEGIELLQRYGAPLPLADIVECWRHGSVIRSWLIDLLAQGLRDGELRAIPPVVEDTGEVNWLVADALEMDVPIPVISQAVTQLVASREREPAAPRAVALMRHGFGGHPYGRSPALQRERRTSRIGGYLAP